MSRIANVLVPQGLGDIFWIYRKLLPHFDLIHFRIAVIDKNDQVQFRSTDLFKDFPKVGSVTPEIVDREVYSRMVNKFYNLDRVFAEQDGKDLDEMKFEFSCNRWLDVGRYLEDMDSRELQWEIDLPLEPLDLPEKYLAVYASGSSRHLGKAVWSPIKYARAIHEYRIIFNKNYPVVVVGATYDEWIMDELLDQFKNIGIPAQKVVNLPIAKLNYVLKNADFFLGYQSGLSIVADHFDTQQIILYFNHFNKMTDRWAKPANRTNGIFNWMLFKNNYSSIFRSLESAVG